MLASGGVEPTGENEGIASLRPTPAGSDPTLTSLTASSRPPSCLRLTPRAEWSGMLRPLVPLVCHLQKRAQSELPSVAIQQTRMWTRTGRPRVPAQQWRERLNGTAKTQIEVWARCCGRSVPCPYSGLHGHLPAWWAPHDPPRSPCGSLGLGSFPRCPGTARRRRSGPFPVAPLVILPRQRDP